MRCVVDEMLQYTGSICKDIRALAERRRPAEWCITECAKIKMVKASGHRGDQILDSILVGICVFVVANTSMSDAE